MELFYHLWNHTGKPINEVPRLVLLHGMGGTGSLWRPLAAALENEIAILSPDQRGHGKSQIPSIPGSRIQERYTPLDYGQDVIDTAAQAQFHPMWVLGHSMGVRTASACAHLRPEWVQGLILIDLGFSGVAGGGLGETLAKFLRHLPPQFESRQAAKDFLQIHCPDPSISQYLLAVSTRGAQGEVSFPFDHSALGQTIEAARDVSVRHWVEELGAAQMPIRVLRGEKSLVWSKEQFETEKAHFQKYPSIEFIEVANASHGLPFEQRGQLGDLIRTWML